MFGPNYAAKLFMFIMGETPVKWANSGAYPMMFLVRLDIRPICRYKRGEIPIVRRVSALTRPASGLAAKPKPNGTDALIASGLARIQDGSQARELGL